MLRAVSGSYRVSTGGILLDCLWKLGELAINQKYIFSMLYFLLQDICKHLKHRIAIHLPEEVRVCCFSIPKHINRKIIFLLSDDIIYKQASISLIN